MEKKYNLRSKVKTTHKKESLIAASDPNYTLKVWIWLYFFLWIFEGGLRKWGIPALSQPLLLVRDPIVLWLFYLALKRGLIKSNMYLSGVIFLGALSFFTAILLGHGNAIVALFGARILLLYFPMIFIIGAVFDQADVIKMGRVVLYISIPMALLITMQFYSPQTAWVNRGVGGDADGAGFSGALGFFRPPGTFSFTNGNTLFFSLVAPFVLYFWISSSKINKLVLSLATGALIIAIPISISRALFFQVAVCILFLLYAISTKPKYFGKIFLAGISVVMVLAVFSQVSFFNTATDAFTNRFEGANETEGGVGGVLGDRFLGQLVKGVLGAPDQSIFGFGIGGGTPLGASMLQNDSVSKLVDFEWMREIAELGLMGLFVIAIRVGLSLKLALASNSKLKQNDFLPWLLMSVAILAVVQGAWGQPTALGFFSLSGGLWLASLRRPGTPRTSPTPAKKIADRP